MGAGARGRKGVQAGDKGDQGCGSGRARHAARVQEGTA